MTKPIPKPDRTSLVIDREKVERVKKILGTTTLAETVDAALEDVINHDRRAALLDRIMREGGIGPGPEELRRLRSAVVAPLSGRHERVAPQSGVRAIAGLELARWRTSELAICVPVASRARLLDARRAKDFVGAPGSLRRPCRRSRSTRQRPRPRRHIAIRSSSSRSSAPRAAHRWICSSPPIAVVARRDPAPLRPSLRRDRPSHRPAHGVARPPRKPRLVIGRIPSSPLLRFDSQWSGKYPPMRPVSSISPKPTPSSSPVASLEPILVSPSVWREAVVAGEEVGAAEVPRIVAGRRSVVFFNGSS